VIAAAGGLAALAMRRRYASATAEVRDAAEVDDDAEVDDAAKSPGDEAAPRNQAAATDDTTGSEVNGSVSKSRR
jgi:hypothetical protein